MLASPTMLIFTLSVGLTTGPKNAGSSLASMPSRPIKTPYALREKNEIRGVALPPSTLRFHLEELRVELGATYDNPFDPGDVTLEAQVTSPAGHVLRVPGFLYEPYSRRLNQGTEILASTGKPEWRVRLCPTEIGKYSVVLLLRDRTGETHSSPYAFSALPSSDDGFVRVSPRDHRYFEFDDGRSFMPIGANACWGNAPGTFSYDDWFPAYGAAGANYSRLWLSPAFSTFGLEQAGPSSLGQGMGQFDLANAWKVDEVLNCARANGLYLLLTIESYNILRDRDGAPFWEKAPQNLDNGGPLRIWSDFWTDPEMDTFFESKLRYIVARWGWDPHVFAWEFWNEVDNVRDYDPGVVRAWHMRMAAYLKQIDPYQHLRTTSFSETKGDREIDQLEDLDFVQSHVYGTPDLAGTITYAQTRKAEYGKPHFVSESGADAAGPQAAIDPRGQQVHDPMWASLGSGASGGAMSWWWDSLIAPNHLYPLYKAFSEFVQGIDFPAEGFRQTDAHLKFATAPERALRRDLVLEDGAVSWSASPLNQPRTVLVEDEKVSGDLPLAGILHGLVNHPELHNPVRFLFHAHRPMELVVEVGDVSGYGGAKLQVSIDGEVVKSVSFVGPESASHETFKSFAGDHTVLVPPGNHSVVIENTGADWMMVGYRIKQFYPRHGPPLQAYAITGETTALVWIRNEEDSWRNVVQLKRVIEPTDSCLLELAGLAAGEWKAVVWNTWAGKEISSSTVKVGIDGNVSVAIPTVGLDVAVKLSKEVK